MREEPVGWQKLPVQCSKAAGMVRRPVESTGDEVRVVTRARAEGGQGRRHEGSRGSEGWVLLKDHCKDSSFYSG